MCDMGARSRFGWRAWTAVAVVTVTAVAIALGVAAAVSRTDQPHVVTLAGHAVVYSVTGEGAASRLTGDITYGAAGGMRQVTAQTLPWTYTTQLRPVIPVAFLSIVAQAGPSTTSITCTITEDGAVVASNTQKTPNGASAFVACAAPIN
jgi:hypothetical protein